MGALQWVATIARPDVARPVNLLAIYLSDPVTKHRSSAALRVLRYLLGTRDLGISYSSDRETAFSRELAGVQQRESGPSSVMPVPKLNLFSDASFASCRKSLNSISGAVLFFRGVPILWRSKRQTIRAYSTMESEWIAASDAIKMAECAGFLDFWPRGNTQGGSPLPDDLWVWVDNKSAITAAASEEIKPKSKHFALRHARVKEEHKRLKFCPTHLQRADGLTKFVSALSRIQIFGTTPQGKGGGVKKKNQTLLFAQWEKNINIIRQTLLKCSTQILLMAR